MRLKTLLASILVFVLLSSGAYAAGEKVSPLLETEEVFQYLLDNHVQRPTAKQLAQGALKKVSSEIKRLGQREYPVNPADDTLEELTSRLKQWQEQQNLNWKPLNRWAAQGMIDTLQDPHTVLFTEAELRRFLGAVENESVGFGIYLRTQNDVTLITQVLEGSPAEAAGVLPGDYLFAVDGAPVKGKNLEEINWMLGGEEGSTSILTVYRPSLKKTISFSLSRTFLSVQEAVSARFDGDIGFVGLSTFGSEAGLEFRDELASLTSGGRELKGLIVDLRDNGGGLISSARDVASLFIDDGILMYTTNRNGIEIANWVRNGEKVSFPVRILVNGQTASASEMLSGALRDHKVAKLVGTRTFGKGSAQQVVPLPGGDALKITLHEYFTPNHEVVNHKGLEPDIEEADDLAQVIRALRSLNVERFVIAEENVGEVKINGITFYTTAPLFKGDAIRRAVADSLANRPWRQAGEEYVPLEQAKQTGGKWTVTKQEKGTTLTWVNN
ncbi:S41 family peptidase [Brevibacillus massiliensis]|uniref:S41 family peptidase n=1 Tax=Brevibacillus massiliensis TaxID=1118054 RepID=UPI00030CFE00|nr:S41 family peptidase [Brevibacillus massiliensis]